MKEKERTELQLRTGPYQATFVGIELLRESTEREWELYGRLLSHIEEAKQWIVGDWLVDGKRYYGDGLYERAERILEFTQGTLRNLKGLSERFELSCRHDNLSWQHHYEVASIKTLAKNKKGKLGRTNDHDMEKAQELLSKAEREGWSVQDLRSKVKEHVRRQDDAIRLANEPERFSLILADPPWEYEFSKSDSRRIDNQYTPTSLEELKKLEVPAAEDSVIFMWAPGPKLREALELLNAWGFDYKTDMVWVKGTVQDGFELPEQPQIGMGYYARKAHELLLIATRGNGLELPDEQVRPADVIVAPRGKHSVKPEEVYDIIERLFPVYRKLELFARGKREGWTVWGDEAE